MFRIARLIIPAVLLFALTAPSASAQAPGPDYVTSPNVEFVKRVKEVGDGVGAAIVGTTMFVTSTSHLTAFDIKDGANPKLLGTITMDVEFENEEVPTNGKLLGISGQIGCKDPTQANGLNGPGPYSSTETTGCLSLYNVSDPAAIKFIRSVAGAGSHTSACILDCAYIYADGGAVTDTRDPKNAKVVANWSDSLPDGFLKQGCHHIREISPGIILGSCQPVILLSVRPEDGGSPEKPVLIASGSNGDERFIHSSRWPNGGRDKFMLAGGETNASGTCDDTVGAFMTWDASKVAAPGTGFVKNSAFSLIDEVRPVNGQYVDGHSPVNGLGCSVHWFQEQPGFKNGGVVALAEYENGTRFEQIGPDGKITEQGFFLPLGGSTSAPHWNPDGKHVYLIDYTRGMDVVRYTGDSYVPNAAGEVKPTPGAVPGTGGAKPGSSDAAPCASAAGFREPKVTIKGRTLSFTSDRRQTRPFTVEVFQQARGKRVIREKRVARFVDKTADFSWKAPKSVKAGFFFVRYTMKLDGTKDVRRVTLQLVGKKFRAAPDYYQRTDCGLFRSFKLGSSAFGGTSRKPLTIAYRLATGAQKVTLEARVGSKLIKRFKALTARDKTYRFSLPAKSVKAGKLVKITATVDTGSRQATQQLFARRL